MEWIIGKVGRHLLLIAIRSNGWQVDCCNIGSQESEEDGRRWIVRYIYRVSIIVFQNDFERQSLILYI